MKKAKRKPIATLNPKENKAWVFAFVYWRDQGLTPSKADRKAWTELKAVFPRLKRFRGCRP